MLWMETNRESQANAPGRRKWSDRDAWGGGERDGDERGGGNARDGGMEWATEWQEGDERCGRRKEGENESGE